MRFSPELFIKYIIILLHNKALKIARKYNKKRVEGITLNNIANIKVKLLLTE